MTADGNAGRVQAIHSETREHKSVQLNSWLEELVSRSGSDLLLGPHAPASMRKQGALVAIGDTPLTGDEIEAAVLPAMALHAREEYQRSQIADSSYRVDGLGRVRIHFYCERGRAAATVRALPSKVPALDELRLPAGVATLAKLERGLVIIGGANGSSETTTLAALVNEINQKDARHIVTIEDPIEYDHTPNLSVLWQLASGIASRDFPTALRA